MKILNKLMLLAAVVGGALASCSDDHDYTPGEKDAGSYLYTDATSYSFLPEDEQTIVVNVGRTDATKAEKVKLSVDNENFSIPSSVSFAAGEKSKKVNLTFDITTGTTEKVIISVDPKNSTVYGTDSLALTVTRDYTWISLGFVPFSSEFFGVGLEGDYSVELRQAKENPTTYKLIDPFELGTNFIFQLDGQPEIGGYYDWTQPTGYEHPSYGMIYMYLNNIRRDEEAYNVIIFDMYACIIEDGSLTPGWNETWTIEMPE